MKAYNYFFYKLYKFWDAASVPKFWSDAKAVLCIIILQLFTAISLLVYYKSFINSETDLLKQKMVYVCIGALCVIFNYYYFYFYSDDHWKGIVENYDRHAKQQDSKGYVIWLIILALIGNFIFACYLYKSN
jgi:small-conductance mechanosensitive channel